MPNTRDGFLNKVFEDSPYGILVADETARIIESNPAVRAMFGYSGEEFTALRIHDILAPDSVQMAEKHFASLEPDAGFMVLNHKRKNGEIFPVELGVRRTTHNGRPALMGMLRDISDRVKAENEIREAGTAVRASQELYHTLTQAMPDFIYALDTDGRITYCNRWLEQFREDPTGKTQHEIFPKETADKHLEVIKKVLETGDPSTQVEEISYPDRKVFLENRLFPVKDESGRTNSLIGIMRDITDQKMSEARLKASETRYLFDNAADPIFIHDDKGRILVGNQALCDTYGYTPEELPGLTLDRVDAPEDVPHIPERMAALFANGSARFTTSHLLKNGGKISVDVRASLILWQGRPAIIDL
ncbi:MAG: PAS/PAC sensor signal transduction histidine kinase [Elusimicrobia bacterium]|nr:MAG: PAS/PAC sensor signal transduction histidine kinase [Elusimicrobiota bacterium]